MIICELFTPSTDTYLGTVYLPVRPMREDYIQWGATLYYVHGVTLQTISPDNTQRPLKVKATKA